MKEIRCPRCGKLLGYFSGSGEIQCPRCRKNGYVQFSTILGIVRMSAKSATESK